MFVSRLQGVDTAQLHCVACPNQHSYDWDFDKRDTVASKCMRCLLDRRRTQLHVDMTGSED